MNIQLINKLYQQADGYHLKFAELIVQECAKTCLNQRDPANLNYKPSERFADAVRDRFDVDAEGNRSVVAPLGFHDI